MSAATQALEDAQGKLRSLRVTHEALTKQIADAEATREAGLRIHLLEGGPPPDGEHLRELQAKLAETAQSIGILEEHVKSCESARLLEHAQERAGEAGQLSQAAHVAEDRFRDSIKAAAVALGEHHRAAMQSETAATHSQKLFRLAGREAEGQGVIGAEVKTVLLRQFAEEQLKHATT